MVNVLSFNASLNRVDITGFASDLDNVKHTTSVKCSTFHQNKHYVLLSTLSAREYKFVLIDRTFYSKVLKGGLEKSQPGSFKIDQGA